MAKARQGSYPIVSLQEAIEMIGKIYAEERTHPVSREVAARHLGYAGLNGASAMALAALAHYGLLERAGRSETKVSSLGVDILYPDSEAARVRSIQEAASRPVLFGELDDRFPDSAPSEANLRHYLLRNEFSDTALGPAIRAYLSTRSFLKQYVPSDTSTAHNDDDNRLDANINNDKPPLQNGDIDINTSVSPSSTLSSSPIREADSWRDVFELEEGEVSITIPRKLSADSFQDLVDWLELVKRKAARSVKQD